MVMNGLNGLRSTTEMSRFIKNPDEIVLEDVKMVHLKNWHRRFPECLLMPYNTLISNQTDGLRN
jgi:hypothetical protein